MGIAVWLQIWYALTCKLAHIKLYITLNISRRKIGKQFQAQFYTQAPPHTRTEQQFEESGSLKAHCEASTGCCNQCFLADRKDPRRGGNTPGGEGIPRAGRKDPRRGGKTPGGEGRPRAGREAESGKQWLRAKDVSKCP